MSVLKLSEGQKLARLIKFYYQPYEPRRNVTLDLCHVPFKTFYQQNKDLLDKAAKIFQKYQLNEDTVIKYLISKKKMTPYNVSTHLLNSLFIEDFIIKCHIQQKEKHTVEKFLQTAEYISDQCVELGYVTTADYLKHLIRNRKLASYYVSGKISKYFLTTIPKFPKIVSKLDGISKDEFQQLVERYDMYKSDVRTAMMHQINKVLSPLRYTDDLI